MTMAVYNVDTDVKTQQSSSYLARPRRPGVQAPILQSIMVSTEIYAQSLSWRPLESMPSVTSSWIGEIEYSDFTLVPEESLEESACRHSVHMAQRMDEAVGYIDANIPVVYGGPTW